VYPGLEMIPSNEATTSIIHASTHKCFYPSNTVFLVSILDKEDSNTCSAHPGEKKKKKKTKTKNKIFFLMEASTPDQRQRQASKSSKLTEHLHQT
jgi:hypothetical protein